MTPPGRATTDDVVWAIAAIEPTSSAGLIFDFEARCPSRVIAGRLSRRGTGGG